MSPLPAIGAGPLLTNSIFFSRIYDGEVQMMCIRGSRCWATWLLAVSAIMGGTLACLPRLLAAETTSPKVTLVSRRTAGTVDRVEVLLEVAGDLKLGEGQGGTPLVTQKMKTVAQLAYEEKTVAAASPPGQAARAWRYYDRAEAEIKVGQETFAPRLRQSRRLIGANLAKGKTVLFSPHGTLLRDELDLVDVVGNSLLLDHLLPADRVTVGDRWKVPAEVVAALFSVEHVEHSEAQATLAEVTDGAARIELTGQLRGTTGGQATTLRWKARCRYDRPTGRVDWFALSLHEERARGLIGPGLDVLATVQVRILAQEKPQRLTEEVVRGLPAEPTSELLRLSYVSPEGGWQLEHDRRWMLISEQGDSAVFRLGEAGQYVAQCSIVATRAGEAGKDVSLAQFQDEIREALGKNFGQFIRASQSPRPEGGAWYRVEVEGAVAQVPVKWVYAMLQDGGGRRAVLAFVIEGTMIDRFGQADQELMAAFRLANPKLASKPPTP